MSNYSPITPPDELVEQWHQEYLDLYSSGDSISRSIYVATQAARWGADQELLACGKYLEHCAQWEPEDVTELYNYRRPKPPSLKEQALDAWDRLKNEAWCEEIDFDLDFVRRALEALPE